MQLYECVVRLGGSLLNEVRKSDVTAAEITVLRALHGGNDTVVQIKPTSTVKRDDYEERDRLNTVYGRALAKEQHLGSLDRLFGHETVPLPQSIRGVDSLPAPKTGRRARVEKTEPDVEPEDADEPIAEDQFT